MLVSDTRTCNFDMTNLRMRAVLFVNLLELGKNNASLPHVSLKFNLSSTICTYICI